MQKREQQQQRVVRVVGPFAGTVKVAVAVATKGGSLFGGEEGEGAGGVGLGGEVGVEEFRVEADGVAEGGSEEAADDAVVEGLSGEGLESLLGGGGALLWMVECWNNVEDVAREVEATT